MSTANGKLKKELRLLDVYAVAMGATISTGFFLLPGLAFAQAGPALILSYVISALLVVPAILSMVELSTAMPKAGGAYYFLDRSMGSVVGTIGGVGTWIVLILKTAFALIGMGAYLQIFLPEVPIQPIAATLAIVLGGVNLVGAKKTGAFQVVLIMGLLLVLVWFVGIGMPSVEPARFDGFLASGWDAILATAGLIYISFAGLTKVTGIAEEVEDPERNLARGMLLALGSAVLIYAVGTYVMVGVVPGEELSGNLSSVATTVQYLAGDVGVVVIVVAAVLAFFAAANAAILSASRYPLAMSRDKLLPETFRKLSARGIPTLSVYVTVGLTLFCIFALDAMKVAKLAGAFQLVIFGLICAATIVMRESGLKSYDPGFRAPLYPWMQIAGILAPMYIISQMGAFSILFSIGMVVVSLAWYVYYVRAHVTREGAMYHVFERLGRHRDEKLDTELRGILKEKGLRDEDPFDEVVAAAHVVDLTGQEDFDALVERVSQHLGPRVDRSPAEITEAFQRGTRVGATPVTHGVALPHIRLESLDHPELVVVRSRSGISIQEPDEETNGETVHVAYALFFLASPKQDPSQHLRILAQIAGRVDQEKFMERWLAAEDEQQMKEVLLRDERFFSLHIRTDTPSGELIGRKIKAVDWPGGVLVAIIQRNGGTQIPHGDSELREGDRLTVIGEPAGLEELQERFG